MPCRVYIFRRIGLVDHYTSSRMGGERRGGGIVERIEKMFKHSVIQHSY